MKLEVDCRPPHVAQLSLRVLCCHGYALLLLTPVTEAHQETMGATRQFPDTRCSFNNFCH